MIKYNLSTIAAAFSTMGRLVNAEKPVVFTKIEGLTAVSCTLFKEAVTHSFKDEDGNVILKRLFIANEDGKTYHFNTSVSPDYRTDPKLPSRIAQAMTIVSRKKKADADKRKAAKQESPIDMKGMVYDERTGDFVPIGQSESPVNTEDVLETNNVDLSKFTTEELAAELFKRGWTITFGAIV